MDILTKNAIRHTLHCLTGCGIGEILGSMIGAGLHWSNLGQTVLATVLAFIFGYGLTYRGARKLGQEPKRAGRTALQTDTISIISMEIIDNSTIYVIPGAIHAQFTEGKFWWSMALSLAIAFCVTVPINRFVMKRSGHTHMH